VSADPRVALLKELAHPLRLRVIDRLGHLGPAPVSALSAALGAPMPELSNHLKRLRDAGLVNARRDGRQAIYELGDTGVELLLPLLDRLVTPQAPEPAQAPSRTCYDHLAGPLGVHLYRDLVERGALDPRPDGTVGLGPNARAAFAALGVDVQAVAPGRRRFAFECLDATEQQPHLAGALGAALADALFDRGWVERGEGRTVRLAHTQRYAHAHGPATSTPER
jgi:DNA-binding transcriptional ArsR family regulator